MLSLPLGPKALHGLHHQGQLVDQGGDGHLKKTRVFGSYAARREGKAESSERATSWASGLHPAARPTHTRCTCAPRPGEVALKCLHVLTGGRLCWSPAPPPAAACPCLRFTPEMVPPQPHPIPSTVPCRPAPAWPHLGPSPTLVPPRLGPSPGRTSALVLAPSQSRRSPGLFQNLHDHLVANQCELPAHRPSEGVGIWSQVSQGDLGVRD